MKNIIANIKHGSNYELARKIAGIIGKDGYVIVIWDGINGEWHFTEEQSNSLKMVNENV